MSDSQAYEEVEVTADGITVTKRFEEDEFPVPAIAFEFVSGRSEPVRVHLSDRVPERIAVEDLGFHPEYGSEYWEVEEDRIRFEREIEAGAEYTTVYGIRATGAEDVAQFLGEPTIEAVDQPLEGADEEDVIPDNDDVVRDAIAGDGEIPGLEDEEEDIGTLDLTDPTREDDAEAAETGAAENLDGIVAAIADEIRSENVETEDLRLLGRAIDHVVEDEADGSTDARIEKLQSDIADLRAYTDALEEFLDEEGTAQQLIGDFEVQLETFDDRLADIESKAGTVDDLESRLDDLESSVGDLEDSLAEVRDVAESDDDVRERVEDMESDIEDLREWQEQIKKTFGG
jgi:methyl-accepting chemotaxis protein